VSYRWQMGILVLILMNSQETDPILRDMPSRNSRIREAEREAQQHNRTHRLRRLKAFAVGISAVVTMGFWWLVSGAVASTQTTATQTTGTLSTQAFGNDGGAFFGGSSGQLGGSTFQRPMLRSGGS
jgi:hypothetical protein